MSGFLIRKEQENAEQAEPRGKDRDAGKRQQGSDRKLLDLLPVAVLPWATWPACSSSISVACKGLLSPPLLDSPPCSPGP